MNIHIFSLLGYYISSALTGSCGIVFKLANSNKDCCSFSLTLAEAENSKNAFIRKTLNGTNCCKKFKNPLDNLSAYPFQIPLLPRIAVLFVFILKTVRPAMQRPQPSVGEFRR